MTEINGRTYDHSDITVKFGGNAPVSLEVLAISYKYNRTVGKLFANTPKKIARTRGRQDPDGELRIPLHQRDVLLAAAAAVSPTGAFGDAEADITVTYGTDNQETITDVLEGVQILDVDGGSEEGEDPDEVTFPLDIMDLNLGGRYMFNEPTG